MQSMQAQALLADEDGIQSDGVDTDRFSGSNSSFLANEKLVSVDGMNSDISGTFFPPFEVFARPRWLVRQYKMFSRWWFPRHAWWWAAALLQ